MGAKVNLYISDGLDSDVVEELKACAEFNVYPEIKLEREKLISLLKDEQSAEPKALIIRSNTLVDESLLNQAINLKLVIRAGEGVDNINLGICANKGVKVENTPGANNNSAAEHALSLMLSLFRKIPFAHESMVSGKWEKPLFVGQELTGKKVGIVGFGRIGKLLAKRLAGFEAKILFYDPFVQESELPNVTKCDDVFDLFHQCDVISLHLPYMKETKHFVSKKHFESMSPHAFFINASRGPIVKEDDLIEALREKKLMGAALDVYEVEPLDAQSELILLSKENKNIVLTPHLGASTIEAQKNVGAMCIHQLKQFFIHDQCINEVS